MNPLENKILELESHVDECESRQSGFDPSIPEDAAELDELLIYTSDLKAQLKSLTGEGYDFKVPTLEECQKAVPLPIHTWPGKCHEIAVGIGVALSLPGKSQYGHYHGPIHEDSGFAGRPFTRHGWWLLEDGRIFDPTRWAFDSPDEPYIHCGEDWDSEYDFGGNAVRRAMMQLPPKADAHEEKLELQVSPRAASALYAMFDTEIEHQKGGKLILNKAQAFWLANAPLGYLKDPVGWDFTKEVYQAFAAIELAGMVPVDNYNEVMGIRIESLS